MQSECLKLEAAVSELYAAHLFTLQLGPVRLCKLGRSSLPSLLSLRQSRIQQYACEFPQGTKMLQVDMIVLLSDQTHQVLLEETTHRQLRKTVKNTSFAPSSPTATHSKETYSFEHLDKCRQILLDRHCWTTHV